MNTETPESRLWTALRYVGRGFLQGAGFCVAIGVAYLIASHSVTHGASERPNNASTVTGEEAASEDVALSGISEEKLGGSTAILGVATNKGKAALHSVHIQANLFNHGKFVDQYSTYLTGALNPGKSQYFKLSCGCKDTQPAEHDTYKLEVITGY